MSDSTNPDKDLSSSQKILLICLSLFLVISLFFFRNGFQSTAMLNQLAKQSLLPEKALSNGRPTIYEFYADWCEACKEMVPDMVEIKNKNLNKVNVVLLNVDNDRWIDLINKYEVNGIPQLTLFDSDGMYKGSLLGVRKYNELNDIFFALTNNLELPSFAKSLNLSQLEIDPYNRESISNNNMKIPGPRDHN